MSEVELSSCVVYVAQQRVVTHEGERHRLTTREAELFGYLSARPSQPISRDELLQHVWGYAPQVRSRACDSAMQRLREKVEADPAEPVHLLTEFGTGYRFEPLAPVRAPASPDPGSRIQLRLTDCTVDLTGRRVVRGEQSIPLTTQEAAVLEHLVQHEGQAVASDDLLGAIWKVRRSGRGQLLHVTVHRLRAKIEADPAQPEHLVTVRGHGYRFDRGEAGLPTGRVALVHAQVHDERSLLASDPEAWQRALHVADERVRATPAPGRLLRQDGLHWRWAFPDAQQAVSWCVELQRAWLGGAWPARPDWAEVRVGDVVVAHGPALDMAVVEGTPSVATDPVAGTPTYSGPEVGRAQCLLAAAHPGQILVDGGAWDEADGLIAEAVELLDLPVARGGRPTVSVLPADLEGRTTLWIRTPASWAALPEVATTFVGRRAELEELRTSLTDFRLVTILGSGGLGKSRIARELAVGRAPSAWADLRGVRDEAAAVVATAAALGVGVDTGRDPRPALRSALVGLPADTLLVLDEAEGAIEGVAKLVEGLLRDAGSLRILVTSRRPLGLPAEHLVELHPLLPAEAAALLTDRSPTPVEPLVAQRIAARVQGIPLAVELAAARSRRLGAAAVADRLDEGLGVLRSARVSSPRPTLTATLDWSVDLLGSAARTAFVAMGALVAPAPLELAEALVDDDDALAQLESLAEHCLITLREGTVDQYAVIRDHAATMLREDPARDEVHERLAGFCAGYGSLEFARSLSTTSASARRAEIVTLAPHLATALAHARTGSRDETFARVALVFAHQAGFTADYRGAAEAAREALARPGLPNSLRAALELCLAQQLHLLTSYPEALAAGQRAVDLLSDSLPAEQVHAVATMARIAYDSGDAEVCLAANTRLSEVASRHGDAAHDAIGRGRVARVRRDLDGAIAAFQEAAAVVDDANAGLVWSTLGHFLEARGDYEAALDAQLHALDAHVAMGRTASVRHTRFHAASAADNLGQLDLVRNLMRANVPWARQAGDDHTLGMSLAFLGVIEHREGTGLALELLDDAVQALRRCGVRESFAFALAERAGVSLAAGDLDAAARDLDVVEGMAADLPPVTRVTAEVQRAQLAARRGDREAAEASLALASSLQDQITVETRARTLAARAICAVWLGDSPDDALAALRPLAEGRPEHSAIGAERDRAERICREHRG